MEDNELSMDSFVDIVANTVGMVIILTMLTIARVDDRGLKLNLDLKAKIEQLQGAVRDNKKLADEVLSVTSTLKVSGAELGLAEIDVPEPVGLDALQRASSLLERLQEFETQSSDLQLQLDVMTQRRDEAQARRDEVSQNLAALRSSRERYSSAMGRRAQATRQLSVDLPELDMNEFERASLTAMRTEVAEIDSSINEMEEKVAIDSGQFNRLREEVEALKAEKARVDAELARFREVTGLEIPVTAPERGYDAARLPVFVECFTRPSEAGGPDELRLRFVGPDAAAEGENYASVPDAASDFRTFLSGQTDEFKRSHRLHFIVRPDAGAAFRKARDVAREEGWTVDWDPIEKGVELQIGAVSPR